MIQLRVPLVAARQDAALPRGVVASRARVHGGLVAGVVTGHAPRYGVRTAVGQLKDLLKGYSQQLSI